MKKRAVLLALYLGFMVIAAACNTATGDDIAVHSNTSADFSENETDSEVMPFSKTSSVTVVYGTETTSQTYGETTAVSETKSSEIITADTASEDDVPEEIFTDEDIYINSFNSDYLSQDKKPPDEMLFIETDEQLSFAEDRYGLAVPDDLPKSDEWRYNRKAADAFQAMKASYPISDYSYAVCYDELNCGGYYLHADRLVKKGTLLYFGMDENSYSPGEWDMVPQVMGGFCHMAAIPKNLFGNTVFENVVYPDKNDLMQDINYSFGVRFDIGTQKLYDAFGGDVILIDSQKEYDDFLERAEKYVTDGKLSLNTDFEKCSAAVCFFTNEYKYPSFYNNGIIVSDGKVTFDYVLKADPDNTEKIPSCAPVWSMHLFRSGFWSDALQLFIVTEM